METLLLPFIQRQSTLHPRTRRFCVSGCLDDTTTRTPTTSCLLVIYAVEEKRFKKKTTGGKIGWGGAGDCDCDWLID